MDADRGPVAGEDMPADSGDSDSGPEARSRSHPLRRLIGPEPPAVVPAEPAEIDVPSLASVSIRRGGTGAKMPTQRQAPPPQLPVQPPVRTQIAVQTQAPVQAQQQPRPAGDKGVGGAPAAPGRTAVPPPPPQQAGATPAANGSGQPPKAAQRPGAAGQATPSPSIRNQAAAPAGGNGVRPAAPEAAAVSIRKPAPSIRRSQAAGPAETPGIRKPASDATGAEAPSSIRRPAAPPAEPQVPAIRREVVTPDPIPAPPAAVERASAPAAEAAVAEAPLAERAAKEPPADTASTRPEPPAPEPRRPKPCKPAPPAPVQARQPAPPAEPAPAPERAAAAPLPIPTPPPVNEGVFDEEGAMRIGYVISVSGRKVYGVMIPDSDVATEDSMLHLQEVSQIGDLVKMPTSRSVAFGMISSLEIRNPSSSPPAATDQRVLEIDLFGEGIYTEDGEFKFQRGISIYPSLGTEIRETTHLELAQIYAKPSESNVLIGSLYQDSELPAYLLVDDLLGKHFAVLGTTGTGKSCSTTVVLRSILDAHPNGHVVLLDPHNEYGQAFDEYAEVVRPDNLNLPFWLLNFEELVEVICTPDQISRKAEVNILKEAVYAAKLQFVGESEDVISWLTVDTPVPYRLSSLVQHIEGAQGQLDRPEESAPYQRIKARIQALRADRRYDFMFAGLSVKDSMAEVLSRLLRIPVEGRPITILQLAGVPSEIVDVVVSVMCRMVFDFAMWSVGHHSVPVLLVCEEAHRYIPQDQATGFTPTRKAIARIAKEGRKYGVSLCLVTQRPSELSETILSQCNTIFTLRMSNERDQVFVRRAMPDSAAGMLNALPALRNQEAIVVGEGVTVPMRIRFSDLESYQRPQSDTAIFSDAWEYDQDRGDGFLHDVVDRWRRQSY